MARLSARIGLLLCAGLLALLATGCGGSSSGGGGAGGGGAGQATSTQKVDATTYVTAFCKAVAPFEKDVATRSKALNGTKSASLAAGKAQLTGYFDALTADSAGALSTLKAAGIPTVPSGTTFSRAIIAAFTKVHSALAAAQAQTAKLSTTSKTGFETGADQVVAGVKTSLGALGSGLKETASNKALRAAAAKVTACHTL